MCTVASWRRPSTSTARAVPGLLKSRNGNPNAITPPADGELDKVQVVDAVWENKEKRQEEPFLSLRLMHGEEAHLLLALNDDERKSLLAFAKAVTDARNPEK